MAETTLQAPTQERGSPQPSASESTINGARGPIVPRGNLFQALATAAAKTALTAVLTTAAAQAEEPQGPAAKPQTAQDSGQLEKSSPEAIKAFNRAGSVHNKAQDGTQPNAVRAAASEWDDFVKQHPHDPLAAQAHHYRGVCLLQLEEYTEAAQHFHSATEGNLAPELREEALFHRGLAHYLSAASNRTLFAEAQAAFDLYLREFPKGRLADRATFTRAESLYQIGAADSAIESYSAVLTTFPESPLCADARYLLGVAQQETNRSNDALKTFTQFVKAHPEHKLAREANLRRADLSFQSGDLEGAAGLYATVRNIPSFEHADYAGMRRATCLAQLGRHSEAAAAFQDVATSFPESTFLQEAQLSAGRALFKADKLSEATSWLERRLGQDNKHAPEAGYILAHIALRQADPTRALEHVDAGLRAISYARQLEVPLRMARADALYASVERREEAYTVYKELFEQNRAHPLAPQALYKAAFCKMERGEYADALVLSRQFEDTFKDHPLKPAAQFVAAESAFQTGDVRTAERAYAGLIVNNPKDPDRELWQVRLARAQLKQEKNAEVLATLSAAKAIHAPELSAEAHYLAGMAHFATGAWSSAATELSAATSSPAQWSEAETALLYLSRAQVNNSQDPDSTNKAVASLTHLLEKFPESSLREEALYQRALLLRRSGDAAGAISDLDAYLAKGSTAAGIERSNARFEKGLALVAQDKLAEATEVFRSVLSEDPDYANADGVRYELAWAYRNQDQMDQALEQFDALASKHPTSKMAAEALYHLAEDHFSEERFDQAAQMYVRALESQQAGGDPELTEKLVYKLGWAHFGLKNYEAALEQFSRYLEQHPSGKFVPQTTFIQAETLFKLRRFSDAYPLFARVSANAKLQPQSRELSMFRAGESAGAQSMWKESKEAFEQLLHSFPKSGFRYEAHLGLGRSLENSRDIAGAQVAYQAAAQADELVGLQALVASGDLHLTSGNLDEAMNQFDRAILRVQVSDTASPQKIEQQYRAILGKAGGLEAKARLDTATPQQRAAWSQESRDLYRSVLEQGPEVLKAEAKKALQDTP